MSIIPKPEVLSLSLAHDLKRNYYDLKRKVKKKESTMAATKITKKGLNVPMLRNIHASCVITEIR